MTFLSTVSDCWLGLCRKPPAVHALPTVSGDHPYLAYEGLPDGGGSGSGSIHRGIGAAISGMRILIRNRQLLWFTLLAGLVLAGYTIAQAAFKYIGWNLHIELGTTISYVLNFLIAFATVFFLMFFLAGLLLSVTSKKECSASFYEGICGAKKYVRPLAGWSVVLTLAGMLLEWIYITFPVCRESSCSFLNIFGHGSFTSTIMQFPFNWTLDWNMLTEFPGYGGRSLLLWLYPYGFLETLTFSAITLLLFILTPFVVPLIVLGHKTLREAVVGSFVMMKKIWAEVAACILFLGVIVSGVFLTYMIIQTASGIVDPYETVTFHPPGTWISLALLYNVALLIVSFVVATVGGIAVRDLFLSAKSRQMPGSVEESRDV